MALQKQKLHMPLTEGIDTDTDDKFILPGKVVLAENGVYRNRESITKRYGFTNLSTTERSSGTSTLTNGTALFNYKDELLLLSDDELYSYSPDADEWYLRGDCPAYSMSTRVVARPHDNSSPTIGTSACAKIGNLRLVVYTNGSTIRAILEDTETGSRILNGDTVSGGVNQSPHVFAHGDTFYFLGVDGSDLELKTLSTASVPYTFSAPTTVISSGVIATNLSVVNIGSILYACYVNSSADVILAKIDGDTGTTSTATITGTYTAAGIAVVEDSGGTNYLEVMYHDGTDYYLQRFDTDLSSETAATSVATAAYTTETVIVGRERVGIPEAVEWFINESESITPGSPYSGSFTVRRIRRILTNAARTSTSNTIFARNSVVASYIGQLNGKNVLVVQLDSRKAYTADSSAIVPQTSLLVTTAGVTIAAISQGRSAFPYYSGTRFAGSFLQLSEEGDNVTIPQVEYADLSAIGIVPNQTERRLTLHTIEPATTLKYNVIDNRLIIHNALPYGYDGMYCFEEGFYQAPYLFTIASPTGSGTIADGTYQFAFAFQWIDAKGDLHRSAVYQDSITLSGGGSQELYFKIATLPFVGKTNTNATNIAVTCWLSEANGQILYKSQAYSNITTDDELEFILNAPPTTSYPILYTQGGVLDGGVSPSSKGGVTDKDRMFFIPAGADNYIQYTTTETAGVAVGYNEALQTKISSESNTAIVSMDEKVLIASEHSWYLIAGDGPSNTGFGSFTLPTKLASASGVKDPSSVVVTPLGIIYKSNKGIELLDRTLQSQPIGAPVKEYDDETILRAIHMEDEDEVRLLTDGGNILVYNYEYNKWSVFTGHTLVDIAVANGVFYGVKSDGQVIKEDTSTYLDNSSFVSMKLKTGWVNFDDVSGMQRLYDSHVIGEYHTPHKLQVKVSYDGDDSTTEDHEIEITSDPKLYDYGVKHRHQKCSTVQYTIQDAAPTSGTGTGQGFSVNGMDLTVGVLGKSKRTPTSRRA